MKEYRKLLSLVDELNNDLVDTKDFMSDMIKSEFKELITNAGDIAILLEKISANSPSAIENKETLDVAVGVVFDIHGKSPETLKQLLSYSGLEKNQIDSVIDTCVFKEKTENKAVCHLFESTALELSLINYPKNKELLKVQKEKDAPSDESENSFDAFVRYLINTGAPNVILEQLARLTIYQKNQLQDELTVNFKFRNIYNNFVEKGEITDKDIEYSKDLIYKGIIDNLNAYPIQIYDNGSIPVAQFSDKPITKAFITGRSPGSRFDAWGVKNNKLLVYCVTTNFDFDNQDIQLVRDAYAVMNGIKKGLLPGIKELEIHALCNPLLSEESEEYVLFDKQIKGLLTSGKITKGDFNALKYTPVHKEILNVIIKTSDDFYSEMENNMSVNFGFHSDKTGSLKLKDKQTQVGISINNIIKAVDTLNKIRENNPTLHRIDTAYSKYAKNLCDAYCTAHSAYLSYYSQNKELGESLENLETSLIEISNSLITTHSRVASSISLSTESKKVIENNRKTYNETYFKEQESLANNTISELEHLKLTTGEHVVNLDGDNENSQNSIYSLILNGKYGGTITQKLLVDTLLHKIPELKYKLDGSIKMNSYNQFKNGLIQGLNKNFDLECVFSEIGKNTILSKVVDSDVELQSRLANANSKKLKM